MGSTRSLLLSSLVIAACLGSAGAQRRWERIPPPRDPQFYVPRNKLEDFEGRMETILIKGRTYVATLRAQNGYARVEATEIRDTGNSTRVTGVVITIVADGGPPGEIRSLIDYEEIDALIKAFDTIAKSDDSITRLTHFEARYRTKGDFEILVFKQVTGGAAAAVEGGFFDRSRLLMTLDDFTKLRWMVAQAKERLDEIK
ncbi:MAG: hypothetical protein QOH70_4198 [Blastocatellia bacterium]|jgi:hypothetical protein|nr:hypothetical protein [Blastocatellia bacterium]